VNGGSLVVGGKAPVLVGVGNLQVATFRCYGLL